MHILTGMSGFSYQEWKGLFYPPDLPARAMLRYYAGEFPVVEINSTFYRMPTEKTLLDWASQVPDGFTFAIKASRRITHNQRLQNVDGLLQYLFQTTSVLERARGPILFLLPPTMKKDIARLRAFLPLLPRVGRVALECRHPSWFDDEVYAALRSREIALVASEQENLTTPIQTTASWGYVRLHRPGYSEDDLKGWLDRIRAQPWSDAYVFFQHEESIAGPQIGLRFRDLAAETISD